MTTGIGAVINTAKVEPGSNVVVFGLGGIGLNAQGARMIVTIIGVDINPACKELGERYGMTHFVTQRKLRVILCLIWSTSPAAARTTVLSALATSIALSAGVQPIKVGVKDHRC